jgi:alkylation response protein AidB-like acyl-CoA dehydrogenase
MLGVGTLLELAPGPLRNEWLRLGAVAVLADSDGFELDDSGRLSGRAEFVPDACAADRFLVLAEGPFVVALERGGLELAPQPVLDETRSFAIVRAEGVRVEAVFPLAEEAVGRLRDRAALALACDSLGLSGAMLDATVAYAKQREQFGRPIGSFQAVKHACADMLVQVSLARELVAEAVRNPGPTAVSMAKAYACGTAVDVVGKAMQLHGGIGYTWEAGIHAYLKRAVLNRSLFGSPAAHRRRLADRYA